MTISGERLDAVVAEAVAGNRDALREVLATGSVSEIDQASGELDTILVMWNVRKAREAAWTNGEVLWHLRAAPLLRRDYLVSEERADSAGRGTHLVPRRRGRVPVRGDPGIAERRVGRAQHA